MLQKVKELSKRKKRPTNAINDRAGNKLTVNRQIQSRRKEDLYDKSAKTI